jgi:metal-sulfur cluster biosynthetic enzyme
MLTPEDIREALRACYGAARAYQRPQNIVDLGLVESIVLTPDHEAPGAGIPGVPAKFSLTLTLHPPSPGEDAQTILRAQIANRLAGLPELSHAAIRFVPNPFPIL